MYLFCLGEGKSCSTRVENNKPKLDKNEQKHSFFVKLKKRVTNVINKLWMMSSTAQYRKNVGEHLLGVLSCSHVKQIIGTAFIIEKTWKYKIEFFYLRLPSRPTIKNDLKGSVKGDAEKVV